MVTKKIKYKCNGTLIKKDDIQVIGETLDALTYNNGGKLKPIDVVKEAENSDSVLHDYFEWDNNKAAKEYRLQKARNIIASVAEVVIIKSKPSIKRSFFSVNKGGQKNYVTLKKAVTNNNYRKELLSKIRNHLINTTELMDLLLEYEK